MTRFPDEEPETWEDAWQDWANDRADSSCLYCGGSGHKITRCPVVMEEHG